MLYDLYINNYFDYRSFILDNAYKLGLSPNDLLVLIYLLDEYKNNNKKIDIEGMENKILLHKNDINNSLSLLLENGFYNVILVNDENGLEEEISVEPFLKKVEDFYTFNDDMTNKQIFALIEKKSKRLLTAADYENINNLIVNDKYKLSDFENTISYLEKAKLDITVRNIIKYIERKTAALPDKEEDESIVKELLQKFKQR